MARLPDFSLAMALPPRIRFFCSPPKREAGTQTRAVAAAPSPGASIVERCRAAALEGILTHEVRPFTPLAPVVVAGFQKRLSFYATALLDPRFDVLTPASDLFGHRRPDVTFQFFDRVFAAVYGEDQTVAQDYSPHYFPVIEALETGVMTRTCALLLKQMLGCEFTDGCLFCKCVDYRFTPTRELTMKLEIGADVLQFFYVDRPPNEALEGEIRLLRLRRPIVCTDPSPDVARVQSALDFRKKMWIPRRARTRTEEVARGPPQQPARNLFKAVRIEDTRTTVKIPEDIVRLCQRP
jgi:hypothetical protein